MIILGDFSVIEKSKKKQKQNQNIRILCRIVLNWMNGGILRIFFWMDPETPPGQNSSLLSHAGPNARKQYSALAGREKIRRKKNTHKKKKKGKKIPHTCNREKSTMIEVQRHFRSDNRALSSVVRDGTKFSGDFFYL